MRDGAQCIELLILHLTGRLLLVSHIFTVPFLCPRCVSVVLNRVQANGLDVHQHTLSGQDPAAGAPTRSSPIETYSHFQVLSLMYWPALGALLFSDNTILSLAGRVHQRESAQHRDAPAAGEGALLPRSQAGEQTGSGK